MFHVLLVFQAHGYEINDLAKVKSSLYVLRFQLRDNYDIILLT